MRPQPADGTTQPLRRACEQTATPPPFCVTCAVPLFARRQTLAVGMRSPRASSWTRALHAWPLCCAGHICGRPSGLWSRTPLVDPWLDRCASLVDAIDGAARVLRPGGVWVSTGPLLYHGRSAPPAAATPHPDGQSTAPMEQGAPAIVGAPKLCADELLLLVEASGFEVCERRMVVCTYCTDPLAMCRSEFTCLHFVARRLARSPAMKEGG